MGNNQMRLATSAGTLRDIRTSIEKNITEIPFYSDFYGSKMQVLRRAKYTIIRCLYKFFFYFIVDHDLVSVPNVVYMISGLF